MKRQIIVLALGSLFALPGFAAAATMNDNAATGYPLQSSAIVAPKTTSQVGDELIAAQRAGNFVINAETGQKANQLDPSAYPAHTALAVKSRAEVLDELVDAQNAGDIVVNAESGQTLHQL
ncbi:MAG: hypothetical protein ACREUK_05400 [Burkholderiales bacterium]